MGTVRRFLTYTLLLSTAAFCSEAAEEQQNSLQLVPAYPTGPSADVLIVTLLDGRVVALDHSTGRLLWTFETGSPLVSVKQAVSNSQGFKVFPGTDGGLYAYHGITHLNPGLERLPISLPELVESAPSLTADGSIILGKRESRVFLLDRRTGRGLTTLSNTAEALEDHSGAKLGLSLGVPKEHLLYVGRQDYLVRSVRMDTKAETWNATFSKVYAIPSSITNSIKDFLQEGSTATAPSPFGEGALPTAAVLPRLVVGTDNSLQAYDPHTMLLKWVNTFDTPPVSAYRSDGLGGNCLDPEQAGGWPGSSGSSRLLPAAAAPPAVPSGSPTWRKGGSKASASSSVLLGDLDGSLYAVPADNLMLMGGTGSDGSSDGSATAAAAVPAVWPRRTGRLPLDITPAEADTCKATPSPAAAAGAAAAAAAQLAADGSNGSSGISSAAVVVLPDTGSGPGPGSAAAAAAAPELGSGVVPVTPVDTGALMDELGGLTCPQPPLGIHPITVQQGQVVSWLPIGQVEQAVEVAPEWTAASLWPHWKLVLAALAALLLLPLLLGLRAYRSLAYSNKALAAQQQLPAPPALLALPEPDSTAAAAAAAAAATAAASPSSKKKGSKNKSKHKHQQQQNQQQGVTGAASNGNVSSALKVDVPIPEEPDGSSNLLPPQQQQQVHGTSQDGQLPPGWYAAAADPTTSSSSGGAGGGNIISPQGRGASAEAAAASAASMSRSLAGSPLPLSPAAASPSSSWTAGNLYNGDAAAAARDASSPSPIQSPAAASDAVLLQQARSYVDADGAVVIGRLRVGPSILGYGSAGTIVYEGYLDSRPVAVKRLLRQFYTLARKEINVLVVSDEHPNVVRCFAMEEDREFVYLALERCRTSLADTMNTKEGAAQMTDAATGAPTPWCMSLLSDIASGLAALHDRQIVHRDLKPHNVLITEAGRAKLSDMGLSKQLVSEQSSFESHGSGGSSGWQAPEQLIAKDGGSARQSRAIDVFSLGCIMFYCLSGGRHPFGETYERDTNIIRGTSNLTALQKWPEAVNLLSAMLGKKPVQRPSMSAVLKHPFWWSDEQKLQFLVDVSDRVENEDREPDPTLLNALESFAPAAVGTNWGAGLDVELIANLGRYRRYDYTALRDLLRVVRNKRNHFREMPESLQQLLGPLPQGYYRYFSSRFRTLLLAVYFFALQHLSDDPNLSKYWGGGETDLFTPFVRPWENMAARATARASRLGISGGGAAADGAAAGSGKARRNSGTAAVAAAGPPGLSPSKGMSVSLTALAAAAAAAAAAGAPAAAAGGQQAAAAPAAAVAAAAPLSPPGLRPSRPPGLQAPPQLSLGGAETPQLLPQSAAASAAGAPEAQAAAAAAAAATELNSSSRGQGGSSATSYLSIAACPSPSGAAATTAAAATAAAGAVAAAAAAGSGSSDNGSSSAAVIVGYQVAEGQEVLHTIAFPSRPGKQPCDFYTKTGHCKFGSECVFDHPPEYGVPITEEGLPFRPGQPLCTFYHKTRQCKFGASCKFHHPKLVPIYAGSAVQGE